MATAQSDCSVADIKGKCTSCKEAAAQIRIGQEQKCRKCMQSGMASKVVHGVVVRKALRHGDTVAVAVSGGPCSLALVALLQRIDADGWSLRTPREVRLHNPLHCQPASSIAY